MSEPANNQHLAAGCHRCQVASEAVRFRSCHGYGKRQVRWLTGCLTLVLAASTVPCTNGQRDLCAQADELVQEAVNKGSSGDVQAAWRNLQRAVEICPDNAAALGNLGFLYAISNQHEVAKQLLMKALVRNATLMEPWVNLGNILKDEQEKILDADQRNWSTVWRLYRTAYRLNPQQVDITANMAGLFAMDRDWEQTAILATKSLKIEFTEEAFCALMKAVDNTCQWAHPLRDVARLERLLARNVEQALGNPRGFGKNKLCYNAGTAALITDLDPRLVLGLARAETAVSVQDVAVLSPALWPSALPSSRRLTLAYVSGHFLNHPMMQMMQGMFKLHDPARVQAVECFATTASDNSELRGKAAAYCHAFHDVSGLDDLRVAELVNRKQAHLLVNLFGFLDKHEPAPVQINHRWCSTTGAPHIAFHVSDPVTSPPDLAHLYSERLALMPFSYLVNDHRQSYQLPPDSPRLPPPPQPALASLNNLYKLDEGLFGLWVRVLREVDTATLALLQGREGPRPNQRLRRMAGRLGVDPARVLTMRPVQKRDHLVRSRNFTLFLDCFKVSSHSTGVDSIWAGVPMVSLAMEKMQARVGAGLVRVLGMSELLARTPGDYVDIVLAIVRSRGKQVQVRQRLSELVETSQLFNTEGWVRDAERMHRMMWDLHSAYGAAHLVVSARL